MPQKHNTKLTIYLLLPLLLFLCTMPAVSRAVQSSGAVPDPTDSYEAEPGTTVARLRSIFRSSPDLKVIILKQDGSVRADGIAETGDRVVITDSSGYTVGCIAITVKGESSGETPPSSPSSVTSAASSETSSEASRPDSSEPSSIQPVSSSSSGGETKPVFSDSIPVGSLPAAFGVDAAHIFAFLPDGTRRESGLVCTGDMLVLLDGKGNVSRTMTVTVLGDLTRCGTVTESGRSLLYGYLTNQTSLPDDLLAAADMNRDGKVDTVDLLKMKLKLRDMTAQSAAKNETSSSGQP
jgi:hypothetical protein